MASRKCFTAILLLWVILGLHATGWSQERFTDNGDGTVTDRQLALMWAKSDNQGDIDWHEARQWIRFTFPNTVPGGYDNWRMPTLAELQSLVTKTPTYESDCGQTVSIVAQIRLSCGWVWTSQSDKLAPTAWFFNFNNIYPFTVRKAQRRGYRALDVRSLRAPKN
jgi:hypothetical protein